MVYKYTNILAVVAHSTVSDGKCVLLSNQWHKHYNYIQLYQKKIKICDVALGIVYNIHNISFTIAITIKSRVNITPCSFYYYNVC